MKKIEEKLVGVRLEYVNKQPFLTNFPRTIFATTLGVDRLKGDHALVIASQAAVILMNRIAAQHSENWNRNLVLCILGRHDC